MKKLLLITFLSLPIAAMNETEEQRSEARKVEKTEKLQYLNALLKRVEKTREYSYSMVSLFSRNDCDQNSYEAWSDTASTCNNLYEDLSEKISNLKQGFPLEHREPGYRTNPLDPAYIENTIESLEEHVRCQDRYFEVEHNRSHCDLL